VKKQNAAYLLDRARVRLRRVSGTDNIFGIDAVEMRARIFDDTVVAALDRPIAGNRDDRMCMDTGGNRRCSHRLEHRVVGRHAEQAARSEIVRVDVEVAGIARKFDARPDDAQWKSKEPAQKLGDRILGEIATAVWRGDEDDPAQIWLRLDEDGPAQEIPPFRREADLLDWLISDGLPHPVARTLTNVEAIIGQLYPATLLAPLISLELRGYRQRSPKAIYTVGSKPLSTRLAGYQSLTMCFATNAGRSAMLSAPAHGQLVQGLDRDRESDRSIYIPLGDVEAGAVRDQRHADQQQKTQGQHLHSRVTLDEIGKRL
jgi:hypothetical protein